MNLITQIHALKEEFSSKNGRCPTHIKLSPEFVKNISAETEAMRKFFNDRRHSDNRVNDMIIVEVKEENIIEVY